MAIIDQCDDIRKPEIDRRTYKWIRLANEMQVLLISDSETDKAAASMDVSVGHASDPEALPGLAHFLEHMLFLGTEKYPDESAYQSYLSSHGGSSNAYTAFENTNYHFDVMHHHLAGALDRFAQFFTCPLFTESATGRELKAIDSENSKNLQSDTWRLMQLSRWAAAADHPHHKFGTGNLSTLVDLPERPVALQVTPSGSGARVSLSSKRRPALSIREALFAFHAEHYSADSMRLVVVGKEPIAELEAMTVPLFAGVPNRHRPLPSWSGKPYDHAQGSGMQVVPVRELRSLTLAWQLPSLRTLYRSKPHRYLSHLIGHESEGSLLSLLKSKGLVDSLCAGESTVASDFSLFEVQMALSEEGDTRVQEIIPYVFQYLHMLTLSPPARWIFDEAQAMAEMAFRYQETSEPMDSAIFLSQSLETHPPPQVISAAFLFEDFDPAAITEMLSLLTPARVMVSHCSAINAPNCRYREAWYGTPFDIYRIPASTLQEWSEAVTDPALRLPEPNLFIPTDFSLECDKAASKAGGNAITCSTRRAWSCGRRRTASSDGRRRTSS